MEKKPEDEHPTVDDGWDDIDDSPIPDDRSDFNLGNGGRWIRPVPSDDDEE